MDWINDAKIIFECEKPEKFTKSEHCDECWEHNQTLLSSDVDTIGLSELGNLGWDPICFTFPSGKLYYTPAFIRLSITSINSEFYFGQFLFHLESDGVDNDYYRACSQKQRAFVADFVAYMIENYSTQIEAELYTDEALRCFEIWSKPVGQTL